MTKLSTLMKLCAPATAALSLAACATANGNAQPGRTDAQSPMLAACAEFLRLRNHELGTSPAVTPQPIDAANARDLFRRAEAFGFSGGLHVSGDGRPLVSEGYGMADRARGVAIAPDTLFDIGSVAKQFTGAAILRLEDMGLLRTDDRITRFFPSVPADKQGMTVHHLLTHTAGFAHDVGDISTRPSRDEAVRDILASELRSAPGAKHAYSNAGYALLAAVVEAASGRTYEGFLRDELWLPLGMTRTGMVLGGIDPAQVAEGYFFEGPFPANRYLADPLDGPSWLVRGAGYIYSTLQDLDRWTEALRTGHVLSDSSRRKFFWPHVRENEKEPSYYGYGWALFSNPDGTCRIGHDGSAGVHFGLLGFLPAQDAVAIAYSTQQRTPWRYFPSRVFRALFGTAPDLPPVASRAARELRPYVGDYRLPGGAVLPVRLQDDRLHVPIRNVDTMRLFSPWPMLGRERTASLGDRQALISKVMNGIVRRDYGPLLERLRSDVDPTEERDWWEDRWPQWTSAFGNYVATDLVGTVEMNDTVRSLALLSFERGAVLVGFVHYPDGRIYIDWMPQYAMREIFLAPQDDGSFLTFSPSTRRTTRVRFEGAEMIVDNGQETVRAQDRRRADLAAAARHARALYGSTARAGGAWDRLAP